MKIHVHDKMIAKMPMKIVAVIHTITAVDELSVWKKTKTTHTHTYTHTHDYLISTLVLFLHIHVGFGWGVPVLCKDEYEYELAIVKGETAKEKQ